MDNILTESLVPTTTPEPTARQDGAGNTADARKEYAGLFRRKQERPPALKGINLPTPTRPSKGRSSTV